MLSVIMAGGRGTRFWPLSRRRRPKQFLDITGRGPMVVETCRRLEKISRDDEIVIIVGREHLEEAEVLFAGWQVHILAEPVGRNTAPCIGLGAVYARYLGYEGPVAFLPADHYIRDEGAFVKALIAAGQLARSGGIVTIGVQPESPATGYGYIKRADESFDVEGLDAFRVLKFVEKPDAARARDYLVDGRYYWNSGIFVAGTDTILQEMELLLPDHSKGLKILEGVLGTERFHHEFDAIYRDFKGISFDYGIMERTNKDIYVIPCQCGWSDVGSWDSLYELMKEDCDKEKNMKEGETFLVDCEGNFIHAGGGRTVACLGLKGCLVVDTGDALLVADLKSAQDITRIVKIMSDEGREDLI